MYSVRVFTRTVPTYGVGGGGEHLNTYFALPNHVPHNFLSAYLTIELRSDEAYGAQYMERVAKHRGTAQAYTREGDMHNAGTGLRNMLRAVQSAAQRSSRRSEYSAIGFSSDLVQAATKKTNGLIIFVASYHSLRPLQTR